MPLFTARRAPRSRLSSANNGLIKVRRVLVRASAHNVLEGVITA